MLGRLKLYKLLFYIFNKDIQKSVKGDNIYKHVTSLLWKRLHITLIFPKNSLVAEVYSKQQ